MEDVAKEVVNLLMRMELISSTVQMHIPEEQRKSSFWRSLKRISKKRPGDLEQGLFPDRRRRE